MKSIISSEIPHLCEWLLEEVEVREATKIYTRNFRHYGERLRPRAKRGTVISTIRTNSIQASDYFQGCRHLQQNIESPHINNLGNFTS
jgi:hypothetical protein